MVPSFKDPAWLDFQADFIIELNTHIKKKNIFYSFIIKTSIKKKKLQTNWQIFFTESNT